MSLSQRLSQRFECDDFLTKGLNVNMVTFKVRNVIFTDCWDLFKINTTFRMWGNQRQCAIEDARTTPSSLDDLGRSARECQR